MKQQPLPVSEVIRLVTEVEPTLQRVLANDTQYQKYQHDVTELRVALAMAERELKRRRNELITQCVAQAQRKPYTCSYCGSTEPPVDDGDGWPYCPNCKGV